MNLTAGTLLALAALAGHAPTLDAAQAAAPEPAPQIALQLACAAPQQLRWPSTCSEIRLRVIVNMGRPQWA
ncbi:hypothetical protein [Duganella aceris]|uniref:Uncharacterized protein n=1 Tax=Duganella aceris TaxID=2703883 RepID=A0ABX0FLR1_9BURK|nr:hypothetical protein [Duganella aceris]NGZ85384.1 hypothetical protein [Duganella aceris]